jgi:hypothetical protein
LEREYVNTFYVGIAIKLNLVLLLSMKGCPSQESPQHGEGEPESYCLVEPHFGEADDYDGKAIRL